MVSRWIAATLLALTTGMASACAHAFLDHATPPVGGSVAAAPASLELHFTEGVVPYFSIVEVLDSSRKQVKVGALRTIDSGRELIVPVPRVAPGPYTVIWHVTSQDTHKTEGRFRFTVAR